jgi:CO/xanthine dehydrogenase Mo-binding subunit
VQFGRGTYGARSAVVGGSALRRAADAIIDKGKLMAAAMLEADAGDIEFKDGNFTVAGLDKNPQAMRQRRETAEQAHFVWPKLGRDLVNAPLMEQ